MDPLRNGSRLIEKSVLTLIAIGQLFGTRKSGFQHPKIEFITIQEIVLIVS